MTIDELRAIVERDARWPGYFTAETEPLMVVADDRRALLALLREAREALGSTRGALVTVAQWDSWASEWLAKHPRLAILDPTGTTE